MGNGAKWGGGERAETGRGELRAVGAGRVKRSR